MAPTEALGERTEQRWLVMTDVDAVQSWLFAPVRLREIAGGSQLLLDYDKEVATLARRWGGDSLYAAGGSGLAVLPSESAARRLIEEAQRLLRELTVSASLSTSDPIPLSPGSFRAARDEAARSLERHKRVGRREGETPDFAWARRCRSCGAEPAVRVLEVDGRDYYLGPACAIRSDARDRSSWLARLARYDSRSASFDPANLPSDFGKLAGTEKGGRRGSLAILVADVNGAGDRLAELEDEEGYSAFSQGLQEALAKALAESLMPLVTNGGVLPFELLYWGGDDIVIACRGPLALRLAYALVSNFCQHAGAGAAWNRGRALGMSACVVIVRPGFPFLIAHEVAATLLRRAKAEARLEGWQEGAVDFVRITEAVAHPEAILADRSLASPDLPDALYLTARPFRAAASGPRSIGGFRDACECLSEFPRNKLYDLHQRCSAPHYVHADQPVGKREVDAAKERLHNFMAYFRSRLARDPENEDRWQRACRALSVDPDHAMWKEDARWRTPVGDLADGVDLWTS